MYSCLHTYLQEHCHVWPWSLPPVATATTKDARGRGREGRDTDKSLLSLLRLLRLL